MATTYTLNQEHNGIEITFSAKPADEIRSTLKENGFRWHKAKKLWYAKQTPERQKLAESLGTLETIYNYAEQIREEEKPTPAYGKGKKTKANKYGVKVGDLFYSSWGYEQTNNNFFQVIELVGASSVRVREVYPPVTNREAVSGMSADITIKNTTEMLPATKSSVFIKDQEHGDLKRLKSYAADGVSNPQFKLDSFADAWKVEGDELTVYESWYA